MTATPLTGRRARQRFVARQVAFARRQRWRATLRGRLRRRAARAAGFALFLHRIPFSQFTIIPYRHSRLFATDICADAAVPFHAFPTPPACRTRTALCDSHTRTGYHYCCGRLFAPFPPRHRACHYRAVYKLPRAVPVCARRTLCYLLFYGCNAPGHRMLFLAPYMPGTGSFTILLQFVPYGRRHHHSRLPRHLCDAVAHDITLYEPHAFFLRLQHFARWFILRCPYLLSPSTAFSPPFSCLPSVTSCLLLLLSWWKKDVNS